MGFHSRAWDQERGTRFQEVSILEEGPNTRFELGSHPSRLHSPRV